MNDPDVAVVIPTLNEARDIAGCLEAVAAQRLGGLRLEVVVADGESADGTADNVKSVASQLGLDLRLVHNPERLTSKGLNRALEAVRAPVTVRVDARARIEPDHVFTIATVLAGRPEIGVVGGAQVAEPRHEGAVSNGIARALRNRWGTGFAHYRWSTRSGPTDTVWMGGFRTQQLRRLGGWAEHVALNEDFELNERYRRAGYVVWYDSSLRTQYLPRSSISAVARQYFRYGRVKGTSWTRGALPTPRQQALLLLPPLVALVLLASLRRRRLRLCAGVLGGSVAAVEVFGDDGSASFGSHLISGASLVSMWTSWYSGVIVGVVGERLAGISKLKRR